MFQRGVEVRLREVTSDRSIFSEGNIRTDPNNSNILYIVHSCE